MVIFFIKRLLDEKQHLSKIWLAAHWEKKLKRPQVFKIDIEKSVQDIMKTEIILDLRISGHLLVGIVKIHSKKTKYLLTECSTVFYQVKIFHAGRIDLPDNKQTAAVNDITLAEYLDDNFNNVINNVVEGLFSTNQSRLEDITLKEATTGRLTLLDDDMMNFEFHEEDEPFEFANIDPMSDLLATDVEAPNNASNTCKQNKATPVYNQECIQNLHADEEERFGRLLDDFLDAEDLINEIPESIELPCLVNEDIQQAVSDHLNIPYDAQVNKRILDTLELEPINASSKMHMRTKSKKRKLCIDYIKCFSERDIHNQVLNTTDIVSVFEMAPSSKRLMTLRDIGCTEKMFRLPILKLESNKIRKVYERNLKTRPSEEFDSNPEEDDISLTYRLRKRSKRESIERPLVNESMSYDTLDDSDGLNVRTRTKISFISSFAIRINPNFTDNGVSEEFYESQDNDMLILESESPIQFQSNDADDFGPSPSYKTSQEKWEYALQGRIVHTLDSLKVLLKNQSTISFSDIAKNSRRLWVAQKFLCLLMLKKFEVISLEQSESYGEIFISRGLYFDTDSVTACSV